MHTQRSNAVCHLICNDMTEMQPANTKNQLTVNSPAASTTPACPISKSTDVQPLCQVDGFAVWRCPESATDFVWPMPDDKTLKDLYDREAWFEGGERGGYSDYDAQTEPSLHLVKELLGRFPDGKGKLTVLDVGCGYGTHLRLAADQGWQCFGIEPSAHARTMAQQRHADRLTVVEQAEDLFPIRFDLILMFEVIEHLQDPYKLLFTLFGRGAIGPETLVVISTPNARSTDAVTDPAGWAYRHPPSHLVFYSAKSFQVLLRRLLFKDIKIYGVVKLPDQPATRFEDEPPSINDEWGDFLGIVAEASGSEFKEFMHERYVPDSYWKLTEYEHFPRYGLATHMAQGARVLDFGCGTGYGTALLGEVAESVVGMDIADSAIQWARQTHRNPKLSFVQRADLGRGLPPGSFDLVTCFEMIEHVDHATQLETIRSVARLLTSGGKLVISTPDPLFTAAYGDNPYHLREMTESEFMELLHEGFKHVTMLKQWVRPSVLIGKHSVPGIESVMFDTLSKDVSADAPVGFVAICSNQPIENPPQLCQFDTSVDFNRQALETEHQLNRLRYENYTLTTSKQIRENSVAELQKQVQALNGSAAWLESQRVAWEKLANERALDIARLNAALQSLETSVASLEAQQLERDKHITALNAERDFIFRSMSWRLTRPLRYLRRKLISQPLGLMRQKFRHLQAPGGESPAVSGGINTSENLGEKHKVLLVLHEFSRTGAPRAVLFLARALFLQYGVRPVVMACVDGPIREEFENEGFPTLVQPQLFDSKDRTPAIREIIAGFERVIVTPLASFPFVRNYASVAKRLTWWIHEEEKGFAYVADNFAPDLAALFCACESIWLGSPLCFAPALQYVAKEKLHLLVYGCDDIALPHRSPPLERMVFTMVGTMEPRKGQDIFLDAIKLLPTELRHKAFFRMIGSPYNDWSANFDRQVCDQARLIPEVECLPNMPFSQLLEQYAETDVVVCASRADPLPISITQGLMFSKTCLCSSVTGHAALLTDGENGLIFENESAVALAEKMTWALQNPQAILALGIEGRKIYEEHFLMSSFADNVKNLLQEHTQMIAKSSQIAS